MTLRDEGKELGFEALADKGSGSELSEAEHERLEREMDIAEERAVQGIASARFRMDRSARLTRAWMGSQDFSSPTGNWSSGEQ